MIPQFRLWRPRSAAEAVAMRAEAGDGAAFMAGGIDMVNRMKFGEPITEVIYLGGVTELCAINDTEGGLHVGSLVTHHQFETCALIRARLPVLAQTWQDVANIRIRCKGTIGGNIMAADPNYDSLSLRWRPEHISIFSAKTAPPAGSRRSSSVASARPGCLPGLPSRRLTGFTLLSIAHCVRQ
jgi:molybdopterin-dependent oxidoreductase-like protein